MLGGLGPIAAMAVVDRQGAELQARFAARRDLTADIAALRERAPRIEEVDALLKDRRSLRLVLEAFQLEGEVDKRAMIRRVLTEDLADPASLANRMADRRWRELAAAFAAGRPPGATPEQAAAAAGASLRGLLDRIERDVTVNRFEKAMGEATPGLREALYFRRMASGATTVAQVMADRVLVEVARGALGLPKQFGLLSFEQQRDLLSRRLDLPALQDPKAVARLAARYLGRLEAPPPAGPAALFDTSGGTAGLSALIGRRISFSV